MVQSRNIPRYVPDEPLPPYTYIPGRTPHPVSDAEGHSFGEQAESVEAPDPSNWESCRPYLYGIDLFNHGYYWEAHEVWEGLWHACGRSGATGSFLKGLIKLAAAGVKAREGRPGGVESHARRAAELIRAAARQLDPPQHTYLGLPIAELAESAENIAGVRPVGPRASGTVEPVFECVLRPGRV